MANPYPSPETRFGAIRGTKPGRVSVRWLKEMLDVEDPETGITKRQMIAKHLIELATSYTVIHAGRDLELASGRDSVEAAKILFGYALGKPPLGEDEMRLALAGHFRQVAKDAAEIVLASLGSRKEMMDPEQVAQFLASVSVNTRAYLDAADDDIAARGQGRSRLMPPSAPESAIPNPTGQDSANDADLGGTNSATPPAAPTTAQPRTENEASPPEAGTISDEEVGEG